VITLFRPEALVMSILTIQAAQEITSIISVTETVALLEHSVGLHVTVCIIRRVSSISSLRCDSCHASFHTESRLNVCSALRNQPRNTLEPLNRLVVTYLDSVQYCGNLMG